MQLDKVVLSYLASEEVCSTSELALFVRLNGGTNEQAAQMLATWLEAGWIETLGAAADSADNVHLTDRAYSAHPELSRPAT